MPAANAKRIEHKNGSGGDKSNRVEDGRGMHCFSSIEPYSQQLCVSIHITPSAK
jgi:hypothetical protein